MEKNDDFSLDVDSLFTDEETKALFKKDDIEVINIIKEDDIKLDEIKSGKVKKQKKVKEKVVKDKKKFQKLFITFIILDALVFIGFFLTYGPIPYFRNILVTSAMETMSHRYLARIFYSDKMIEKIMSGNKTIESGESTNTGDIKFDDIKETDTYASIYEEQILKKDKDAAYKVIDVSGSNYKGHLIAIYDASRINLVQSANIKNGGQQLVNMTKEHKGLVAINSSGFVREGIELKPVGAVIMNGKLISNVGETGWGGGLVGFNKDNVLVLTKDSPEKAIKAGMRDAMSFGPFLIVNGSPSKFSGNGGYGLAPRTAIAQRKDGIVLFLVIDGRRPGHSIGIDMVEMTNLLIKYGAYNASNLDGGGSSSLVVNNEVLNIAGGYGYDGDRFLPNAWMLK